MEHAYLPVKGEKCRSKEIQQGSVSVTQVRNQMLKKKATYAALAAFAAPLLFMPATAVNAAVVGFDPSGSGTPTIFADLWTDLTDSGLDEPGNANIAVGSEHTFTTQLRVAAFQLNGIPQVDPNLNVNSVTGYELTKEIKFKDLVTAFDPVTNTLTLNSVAGGQAGGTPELTLYIDQLGDGSQARPGNGGGTVACYGSGTNCAGNPDGLAILTADIASVTSSFTASGPTIGTGSFDVVFQIASVDDDYLTGLGVGAAFAMKITGTLNVPSFFSPAVMWDGTVVPYPNPVPLGGALLFKVDSSESFRVPEPATLALLGIGFIGMRVIGRRCNKNTA